MAGTGIDQIRAAVEPAVSAAGLYLEDVAVQRAGDRSVVRVTVDLGEDELGSVDLDAIADVSRAISAALDDSNAIRGGYTLEVSSPGTSRRLTEPRHFKRARGRIVRLSLRDGTSVEGRLTAVDENLELSGVDGGLRSIALEDVVRGKVQVELSPLPGESRDHDGVGADSLRDEEG